MKTILILIGTMIAASTFGQTSGKEEKMTIEKAVKLYAKSGDNQDVSGLKNVLHPQYRLVWWGGEGDPFISDKAGFIAKFEAKEYGGDSRSVSIQSVEVFDGINASVKAVMDGKVAEMRSLFSLIKVNNEWKIVGELVNATFK